MRISKEKSTEKKNFVLSLFAENINLTQLEVQTKVKEKFQQMMSPNTILALKNSLTKKDSPIVLNENPNLDAVLAPTEGALTGGDLTILVAETGVKPLGEIVSPNYSAVTDTDPTPPVRVAAPAPIKVTRPDGTVEIEIRPGLVEIIKPEQEE